MAEVPFNFFYFTHFLPWKKKKKDFFRCLGLEGTAGDVICDADFGFDDQATVHIVGELAATFF